MKMKQAYVNATEVDGYLGDVKGVVIRADFHTSGHIVSKNRVKSNPENRVKRGATKSGNGPLSVNSDSLNWGGKAERMLLIKDGDSIDSEANGWIPAEYVMIPVSELS